jgi:hypothetical protein
VQEVVACRERCLALLLPAPTHFRECAKRDEKAANWCLPLQTQSRPLQGNKGDSLKLKERTGNVYENKGPLQKTWERTGNVYEN